ncbi:hypothetical protein J2785_007259 [Burkholderia ambifaria]|nr:hypothetical protein [Burkholderia ambifaria]
MAKPILDDELWSLIGFGHRVHDLGQRAEVDALAGTHGFHAQRNGQM